MKKTKVVKKADYDQNPVPGIHIRQIDIIKGFAIISVILIHTFSNTILMVIGAPFHIWQAVPVFILLAAFTSTIALVTYRKRSLADSYDISIMFRRIRRILEPYTVIWVIQALIVLYVVSSGIRIIGLSENHFWYQGFGIVLNYFSGGNGPGNYFIPVILQQILIIPLFYYLALRSPDRMLVTAFILDLLLEFLALIALVPPWLYGILYIRYIFAGALGVWLAFRKDIPFRWVFIGGFISFVYIFLVQYLNFQFWFIYPDWAFFHAFSYFWTLLLVILGLRISLSGSFHKIFRLVEQLGKASWHIFLVQMTFFFICWGTIGSFIESIIFSPIISLAICLPLGYGFYRVDLILRKTGLEKRMIH